MIHYLPLGGKDRPLSFSYANVYEYELATGRGYEYDVAELALQVIRAGQAMGTDDVGTAARGISMVRFFDVAYAALRVGHLKAGAPAAFTVHDVAEWFGADLAQVSRFTELLLEANFNLDPRDRDDDDAPADDSKKKALTTAPTGPNS